MQIEGLFGWNMTNQRAEAMMKIKALNKFTLKK